MDAPRKRALVGECISRASVEAARDATLADLEAALAACDYERAATIAFARARAGEPIGTELIARILPGIELPAITCSLIAIAPDRAALLDVVARRHFPQTKDAGELEAITLFAAWKAGAPTAQLIAPLRRLSARSLTAEGYALLATIAASIDDPNVAAATRPIAPFAKEHARNVAADHKAMTASIDGVLAELPAEVEAPSAAGFTVRGGKQPGRNDPCPCGSGLKYKKCCADKPQAAPSPVPGLSWDEFLGAKADQMTVEHVEELALKDLVRVDLRRLAREPRYVLFRRLLTAHERAHVERVIAVSDEVDPDGTIDMRDEYVLHLLDDGDLERARTHIERLPAEIARSYELDLAMADRPARAYEALVEAARAAAASDSHLPDLELAYTLLRAEPALGIVAARACIGTMHVDDGEILLEAVEEARDELNLPPGDAAWDVLDALHAKQDARTTGEAPAGTRALDTQLAESSARIDQLERTLAAMKAELDAARTRPVAELVRAPEATGGLETRVRELEALIREGNAERRELRKQLETREAAASERAAAASERNASPRARRATLDEPDEGFDETELVPGARDITIPRFDRRFVDALGDVPTAVGAEAMRTIGTLAAGDGFAWRGVKQAKDMSRQVLMARVGIHHRLIFRSEDAVLEVLDLVTREQLLTTLKRLRAK